MKSLIYALAFIVVVLGLAYPLSSGQSEPYPAQLRLAGDPMAPPVFTTVEFCATTGR